MSSDNNLFDPNWAYGHGDNGANAQQISVPEPSAFRENQQLVLEMEVSNNYRDPGPVMAAARGDQDQVLAMTVYRGDRDHVPATTVHGDYRDPLLVTTVHGSRQDPVSGMTVPGGPQSMDHGTSWEQAYFQALNPDHTARHQERAMVVQTHIMRVSAESRSAQDEVLATAHIQTRENIAATGVIYSPRYVPPPAHNLFPEYHRRPVFPIPYDFENAPQEFPHVKNPENGETNAVNLMDFYIRQYNELVLRWIHLLEVLPQNYLVHLAYGFAKIEAEYQRNRERIAEQTNEELSFAWYFGPFLCRRTYSY
ncbi:hypothetical protein TWF970_007093 [Orbilia oligospora]|uniref:Uncharacterized protein n=1 Tax=Orbilia oligospora TaxID=2813651 RepID=A0A7C8VPA9_ORBOL|nr:hypothetical protein TWF970_007093 [Orbilia oligospora]